MEKYKLARTYLLASIIGLVFTVKAMIDYHHMVVGQTSDGIGTVWKYGPYAFGGLLTLAEVFVGVAGVVYMLKHPPNHNEVAHPYSGITPDLGRLTELSRNAS